MLTEYRVLQQQNIFDLICGFYGSVDKSYAFIQSNPSIDSINYDFENNSNVQVFYDASYLQVGPSEIPSTESKNVSKIQKVKAYSGQNLYDMCFLTYGTIDRMYEFLQTNSVDSINVGKIAQNEFIFDITKIKDNIVFNHNSQNGILYATGDYEDNKWLLTENEYVIETETEQGLII